MALTLPSCLKVLICVSALMSLILLWCFLAGNVDVRVNWRITKLQSPAVIKLSTVGIDFQSLFNSAVTEPHCDLDQVLLILVTSAPWHSEARQVIRTTWAAAQLGQREYPWQTVFLIGKTLDVQVTLLVQKEKQKFGDILIGNYLDTYRNLTRKVMHGLKWAIDRCQPEYILKTDDDCFVNTDRLPAFLGEHNTLKTGLYVGSLFPREKRLVIREPSSKWYVSRRDYQPDVYPPYASGIGYILSFDAVVEILQAAEYVRPIPVEDVYVGVLAEMAGIQVKSSGRFAKHNVNWRVCNYRYLMVIHHLNAQEQELAKVNMLKARTACLNSKEVTRWK